jgi:radical SAM superfamily enzyme YgiQ (UPF0313 family)
MHSIILIYPPAAKLSEPPAGIARLSGFLKHHGVNTFLLDANLEGMMHLLNSAGLSGADVHDTWTKRALRNCQKNIASLRESHVYAHPDRYRRAVADINRVLEVSARAQGVTVGLANYQDSSLSPLRSSDLIRAAETFEENPFYPYFSDRLTGLIGRTQPSLIGFSLNYLSQAICTFAMAGFIRKRFPGLKIVLGGGLVTSWMRRPGWISPFDGLIDHLIAGPGEYPLLSLLGIEGEKKCFPVPDFGGLPAGDYLSPGRVLPCSASSGCYWQRCAFCPEKAEGNPYVAIPVRRAMEDINSLVSSMDPALLHLLDNAISPALLGSLAENPPGPAWYGFARIDRQLTDSDFCMALKRSGCVMLKLGVESGDQGVLDMMEKGIDLDMVSRALKALKGAGIATYVYLLFGTPYETLTEARRTLEFTESHREDIGFLNVALFNMPVSAEWTREFETSSFYEGDLSLYRDFFHPRGWNRKQVRDFLENEFKKNRAVSFILKKDPPIFTSNHAPFFVMKKF